MRSSRPSPTSAKPPTRPDPVRTAFLRDLAYLLFGQMGARIVGFITFAYLARVLSPAGYGALEAVIALTGIFAILVDFGVGAIGVRRLHAGDRAITAQIPALRLPIACGAALLVALLYPQITGGWAGLGLLFALSLPLLAFRQDWIAQAQARMDRVGLAEALRALVLALLVLALVISPEDLLWVGVAELGAVSVFVGYLLWMQRRAGFALRLQMRDLSALSRESAPLAMAMLAWGGLYMLPPVIVTGLGTVEEGGQFSAALRLIVAAQVLSQLYHFNLFTELSRRAPQERAALALASLRLLAWATIGPVLLGASLLAWLPQFVFGADFAQAGDILVILLPCIAAQLLAGHARWLLVAAGENRAVLRAGLGAFVALALLLPLAQWRFGAEMAAQALVASACLLWIGYEYAAHRAGLWSGALRIIAPPVLAAFVAALMVWGIGLDDLAAIGARLCIYVTVLCFFAKQLVADFRQIAYARHIGD